VTTATPAQPIVAITEFASTMPEPAVALTLVTRITCATRRREFVSRMCLWILLSTIRPPTHASLTLARLETEVLCCQLPTAQTRTSARLTFVTIRLDARTRTRRAMMETFARPMHASAVCPAVVSTLTTPPLAMTMICARKICAMRRLGASFQATARIATRETFARFILAILLPDARSAIATVILEQISARSGLARALQTWVARSPRSRAMTKTLARMTLVCLASVDTPAQTCSIRQNVQLAQIFLAL